MRDLFRMLAELEQMNQTAEVLKDLTKAAMEDIAVQMALEAGHTVETFAPIVSKRVKKLMLLANKDTIEIPGMREELERMYKMVELAMPGALKIYWDRAQKTA